MAISGRFEYEYNFDVTPNLRDVSKDYTEDFG